MYILEFSMQHYFPNIFPDILSRSHGYVFCLQVQLGAHVHFGYLLILAKDEQEELAALKALGAHVTDTSVQVSFSKSLL